MADELSPSIVFIDEIDAVGTKRSTSATLFAFWLPFWPVWAVSDCSWLFFGQMNLPGSVLLVMGFLMLFFGFLWVDFRYDSTSGGEREIQRTMLELLNQLDGFDSRGDVKVILATNRIESLDPALLRPGRIDRKIEFPLPDIKTKRRIFQVGVYIPSLFSQRRNGAEK